jgi:sigma-B regulation protein RsbU (phosphoserine phosphatase)
MSTRVNPAEPLLAAPKARLRNRMLLWNYLTFRERLTEEALLRARFLADGSADRIDTTLGGFKSLVDGIALSFNATALDLSLQQVRDLQRGVLNAEPGLYGMAFAWLPERKPEGWDAYAPYTYRDRGDLAYQDLGADNQAYVGEDWFTLPRFLNQPVWTEPYIENTGARMVTYSAPVRLPSPEGPVFAGVVTCDIELAWLDRLLRDLPLGMNGYALLLSRNGVYISHPLRDVSMIESIFSIAEARGDTELRKVGQAMLSGEPGLRTWIGWANAEPSWLAWDPLSSTGWTAAVLISQDELNQEILQLTQMQALAGGGGLLLLVLTVGAVARSITRPITALSDAAPRIAAGELDSPLPVPKGRDEVAQLTTVFRTMRDHLKRYIADLEETTAERERINGELRIAHDIQMDLVPKTFPPFPNCDEMDLFAIIEPAREVGGDFYDFMIMDDDRMYLAIADVSGKGVPAALFMAVTRGLLRAEAKITQDPGQMLERLNDALAEHNDSCMFVTLFCAVVRLSDGWVDYVNAGHNPPLWLREDGSTQWLEHPLGVAAGPVPGQHYETGHIQLALGDSLLFYTDGVNEAINAEEQEFGNARLFARMHASHGQGARETLEALLGDIREHVAGAEQFDDITMMLFRRLTASPTEPVSPPPDEPASGQFA